MARGTTTKRQRTAPAVARACCTIVLIDQGPVRRAAGGECSAAMARLDEARASWHRFERDDKRAFARWRAREFGPLLSRARDVEIQIREHETLVHEVEMEMRRGFYDPHSAYRRVLARRADPSSVTDEPPPRQQPRAGEDRSFSEFEKEALFGEWVKRNIGTNPDKLDDEAYTTTFEAFKSHMFRSRRDEPPPSDNFRRGEAERTARGEEEPADSVAANPVDARVKELYRLLVRRLHPDRRANGSAVASALWHEVQEAYAATDVAQLEILLALSDIESDQFSDQTSLSQMQAVLAELERALFALHDSLRQARHEDAWDFARTGAVDGLRERVERELKANFRMRSLRLEVLQRTIAAWSQPRVANRPLVSRES